MIDLELREIEQYAQDGGLHSITFEDGGQTLTVLCRIKSTLPEAAGAVFYDSPGQKGEGVWIEPLIPTFVSARHVVKVEPVPLR